MYGTLLVTVDAGKNAIVVPADAVVRLGTESYVFVQIGSADGRTQFRKTAVSVESVDEGFGTADAERSRPLPSVNGNPMPTALQCVPVRIAKGSANPAQIIVQRRRAGTLFNEMNQHIPTKRRS